MYEVTEETGVVLFWSGVISQVTWLVHEALTEKLREMDWKDGMSMLDFYYMYYVPFGELLTDMERCPVNVVNLLTDILSGIKMLRNCI